MADYTTITAAETDPGKPVSSALVKALEENPRAIAEAGPAIANNLRPTQLLGTLTTTSGTTQTLGSLDLTNFRAVRVVIHNVSHDNISNRRLQVKGDGSSWGDIFTNDINSAYGWQGILDFDLINGLGFGEGQTTQVTGTSVTSADRWLRVGLTTASTAIDFRWTAGSFDAGTIRIYGVK